MGRCGQEMTLRWPWQKKRTEMAVCICLLPIGAQTAGPNGLKFGMGAGMDHGTVCG